MKKLMFLVMAFAAILLTGCKHSSCTLVVTNEYTQSGMVLFSTNKQCSSIEDAEFVAQVPAGQSVIQKNVKLDGLYAIFYVANGNTTFDHFEAFARKGSFDLGQYVGMGHVTCTITSNGLYAVEASNF